MCHTLIFVLNKKNIFYIDGYFIYILQSELGTLDIDTLNPDC